jgi:RecA/RadA recombinase
MRTKSEEAKKAAAKKEKQEEKVAKNYFAPVVHEDNTAAERKRVIANLVNAINKEKKYTVIAHADDVVNPYFLRRPSGIMQLDIDTGGGLPAGGVSMLSGPDNTGKTFLLYKYCAQQQRLYGNNCAVAIAPVEGAPDYFFMRKCGFMVAIPDAMIEERNQKRKERGLPLFTKEERMMLKHQVGTVILLAGKDGEDLLDAVHESVRSNVFNIIGIDSITALLPQQGAKQDTLHDQGQRASHASLVTNFFARLYPFFLGMWGRNDTTIICTQQVRSNPAAATSPYVKAWAPAGSYAAKHGKMIDLLVYNGEKIRKRKDDETSVLGKWINWETLKGKGGTHDNIRGDVAFYYDNLTYDLHDIVTTGIRYKAFVEEKGYLSLVHATTGEIREGWDKLAGVERVCEKMALSLENEMLVRQEVLAHANVECAYL